MICHIFVCKTPTKCGQGLMNKSCQIFEIMTQKQSAPKTHEKFCVKTTKYIGTLMIKIVKTIAPKTHEKFCVKTTKYIGTLMIKIVKTIAPKTHQKFCVKTTKYIRTLMIKIIKKFSNKTYKNWSTEKRKFENKISTFFLFETEQNWLVFCENFKRKNLTTFE